MSLRNSSHTRNLEGNDYIGRFFELLAYDLYGKVAESCRKHSITRMILVGTTHVILDAAGLVKEF